MAWVMSWTNHLSRPPPGTWQLIWSVRVREWEDTPQLTLGERQERHPLFHVRTAWAPRYCGDWLPVGTPCGYQGGSASWDDVCVLS